MRRSLRHDGIMRRSRKAYNLVCTDHSAKTVRGAPINFVFDLLYRTGGTESDLADRKKAGERSTDLTSSCELEGVRAGKPGVYLWISCRGLKER